MLVQRKLPRHDEAAPELGLEVHAAVEHPPGPRMKASGLVAVQPGEDPWRMIRRALLRTNELHAIVKTASLAAIPTPKMAIEEPQSSRAPAAAAEKETPIAAVRPAMQRQTHVNPSSPTRSVTVFISGAISPSARKRAALTDGRSSIACLMRMKNRPS